MPVDIKLNQPCIWACSNQQETTYSYVPFHLTAYIYMHACKVGISYNSCYFHPLAIFAICKRANGFLLSGSKGDFACHFVSIPLEQRGSLCKLPVAWHLSSHLFPEHLAWRERIVPLVPSLGWGRRQPSGGSHLSVAAHSYNNRESVSSTFRHSD
jgi:hypothetical protein